MQSKATKRILSLLTALLVVAAPLTASAAEETISAGGTTTQASTAAPATVGADVLPNLSNLQDPITPPEVSSNIVIPDGTYDDDTDAWHGMKGPALPSEATPRSTRSDGVSRARDTTLWTEGSTQYFYVQSTYDGVWNYEPFTLVKDGSHCYVFVAQSGAAPAAKITKYTALAGEIDQEFTSIYQSFVNPGSLEYIGKLQYNGQEKKIALLFYDIESNESGSTYTSGYFANLDFFEGYANSNEYPTFSVDIVQGDDNGYEVDKASFYGTLAHEYQHIVNFGYFYPRYISNQIQVQASDPDRYSDGTATVSTWLNEGLSGLVDILYSGAVSSSHLSYFLASNFASANGYVPTKSQWNNASGSTVLANYGSAALLMYEYYQYKGLHGSTINSIVDDSRTGYYNSMNVVADNFWTGANSGGSSFDDFFQLASLDLSVDTPDGSTPVNGNTYRNLAVGNMWTERDSGSAYAGVGSITLGTQKLVNTTSKTYYNQLFISDPIGVGKSVINVNVPNTTGADYFVIAPDTEINVDSNAKWNATDKIAKKLGQGDNQIIVGTNNRFAILVVNYGSRIATGSFTATLSNTAVLFESVTTSPDPLVSSAGGSVAVTALIQDGANKPFDVAIYDANGTVVAAPASYTADANGRITTTLTIPTTATTGAYTIRVYNADQSIMGEYVIYVTVKATLNSPTGSSVAIGTSGVTIDFDAPVTASAGTVDVAVNGETYSAALTGSGTSFYIPMGSFKNGTTSLLLLYGQTYAIAINGGAVIDANQQANVYQNLGSFTVEGESVGVTVSPQSLNMAVNESSRFVVYFGTDSNAPDTATITPSAEGIVTLDTDTLTSSGTIVTVTGKTKGSVSLSIGFSGPVDIPSETVEVEVTGGSSGGDVIIVSPGPTGSGSGGTVSGSGGGSGGSMTRDNYGSNGIINATTGTTLTSATALKAAEVELAKATAAGSANATVTFTNMSDVPLKTMQDLAEQAKKAGIGLNVNIDTVVNGKVLLRISFNPADATKDVKTSGSIASAVTNQISSIFATHYTNTTAVVALDQPSDFGMTVQIAAKLDLEKMDTKALNGISYSSKANTYRRLGSPGFWVDKNGYLHLSSTLADNLVFIDKALTSK